MEDKINKWIDEVKGKVLHNEGTMKQEIEKLVDIGIPLNHIAQEANICYKTLYYWLNHNTQSSKVDYEIIPWVRGFKK